MADPMTPTPESARRARELVDKWNELDELDVRETYRNDLARMVATLLDAAIAEALERAAKECDKQVADWDRMVSRSGDPQFGRLACEASRCARRIRSLPGAAGGAK